MSKDKFYIPDTSIKLPKIDTSGIYNFRKEERRQNKEDLSSALAPQIESLEKIAKATQEQADLDRAKIRQLEHIATASELRANIAIQEANEASIKAVLSEKRAKRAEFRANITFFIAITSALFSLYSHFSQSSANTSIDADSAITERYSPIP